MCLAIPWQALGGAKPLAVCKAQVQAEPRTLKGYICLMAHQGEGLGEVLRFLDARMQSDPENPRPHLYAGVMRVLAGQAVDDREWRIAIAGFAREHDLAGEVYATSSLLSARCGRFQCDDEALALLRRTRDLALASGRVDLQEVAEVWTMKVAFVHDDMDAAEGAERRLLALGPPASLWIKSEALTARAHLAAMLGDYRRQRELYTELLQTLDADDRRWCHSC